MFNKQHGHHNVEGNDCEFTPWKPDVDVEVV